MDKFNIFDYEPHKNEKYFDSDENRVILEKLCRIEPNWAANVIRTLKREVWSLKQDIDYYQKQLFALKSK